MIMGLAANTHLQRVQQYRLPGHAEMPGCYSELVA